MAEKKCPPLPSGSVDLSVLHEAAASGGDLAKAVAAATTRPQPKPEPAPEPAQAAPAADEDPAPRRPARPSR